MKTAVTVLQEIMIKMGQVPEYECIAQSGPQHFATFDYRCRVRGEVVTATARSKKEAKQEAARLMLLTLAAKGTPVPPPYNMRQPMPSCSNEVKTERPILGSRSYVALLKDLCEEYHLPAVEYELVGDTGPPHMRQFTIRAQLGQHERLATSTTKKAARQLAAEQLYTYMRENLARLTKDFVEEEALVRAHERAMERYVEIRDESVWRPDLGQKIADYHLGLKTHLESEKCGLAFGILESLATGAGGAGGGGEGGEEAEEAALQAAAVALGITVTYSTLPGENSPVQVVELNPTSPALSFAGITRRAAVLNALRYMRLTLV